jgi:hypothetical protein
MTPNPKGVMEKNNKLMIKMDKKRESNRVASEKKRTTSDGYMPSRKLSVKSATPNEDKVAFHSSVEKKGGKAYRKETSHTVGGVAQSKNKLDLKVKQRTAQ